MIKRKVQGGLAAELADNLIYRTAPDHLRSLSTFSSCLDWRFCKTLKRRKRTKKLDRDLIQPRGQASSGRPKCVLLRLNILQ